MSGVTNVSSGAFQEYEEARLKASLKKVDSNLSLIGGIEKLLPAESQALKVIEKLLETDGSTKRYSPQSSDHDNKLETVSLSALRQIGKDSK